MHFSLLVTPIRGVNLGDFCITKTRFGPKEYADAEGSLYRQKDNLFGFYCAFARKRCCPTKLMSPMIFIGY